MRLLNKLRQKFIPITCGLVVVVLAFMFEVTSDPNVSTIRDRLNSLIYDLRMTVSLIAKKPLNTNETDVVIINIDEKSLKQEGRWPWPRQKVIDLLEKIRQSGATVIAFDAVFAEPQANLADQLIYELNQDKITDPLLNKDLQKYHQLFDDDQDFAKVLTQKNDITLGFILTTDPQDKVGLLPEPILKLNPEEAPRYTLNNLPGQIGNIPVLQESAKKGGYVTSLSDVDGIIRRASLVMIHDNAIYPSLPLAAVMEYYFLDTVDLNFLPQDHKIIMTAMKINNQIITTDSVGQVLIPYKGISGSIPSISAADVMNGNVDNKMIKNKIVFIGASALGLGDLHATPFETSYPGVEIHATVADALLKSSFPVIPDWSLGAKVVVIVSVGFMLALMLPYLSVLWVILVPIFSGILLGSGSIWLFTKYNIYLSSITVYLMMGSLIIVNAIYGFLFEARKRAQLKEMFGQYVPPAHVEKMSESKLAYTFEGESREMSVLFADIRSFTSISEKLDPTQLKKLLNEYFTPMTEVIFDNGGTIDKYVGDMIMAFWGAPLANPNHALDAVKAGLAMQKAAAHMQGHFKDMGIDAINIGVGINSGFMNVGDMGSKYRRSYTVLGDNVNLASRLESSTKFYHTHMIISQATLEGCHGEIIARHLDRVKVVGKKEAVEIYTPLCMKNEITPEISAELETHSKAESLYFEARWDEALTAYEALSRDYPNVGLYPLYVERIKELKAQGVSAPWDGCYVRVSK